MKPLALADLGRYCAAEQHGADVRVESVTTDSRSCKSGSLFAAIAGERVDGHDFVAAAQAAGAVAALVTRVLPLPLPQLLVADTTEALGRIAAHLRLERSTKVLGLTGSNGKTTVKTLLAGILSGVGNTYANPGNRNNELGMPLALIEQPEDAAFAIYEMGAGAPGDIDYLARIAKPQVALVNNVAPAHLERLGSLLGVAQTKGAIYAELPADGIAVINADDPFGPWFEQRLGGRQRLRFALAASAEVVAEQIRLDAAGSSFRLLTPGGSAEVRLPLPGRHNIANALAAAAMALAAGASIQDIEHGLCAAVAVAGRLQAHLLASGARLIDDSYNANPASVTAAIETLAAATGERWLVLGDMRELGADAERLHAQIGAAARQAGLQRLYAVGPLCAAATKAFGADARHFDAQQPLRDALLAELHSGVTLLIKGSRGSRMDRVVNALLGQAEAEHAA